MGDGIDDDGWETVSEHTVNSGEEEEEQEEKEQKQKQEAGQRKKNMQEAAEASPASEADAGGSSVKSKSEPSAAAAAAAAADGGGGQPQGIVPEAEDLKAFVAEQVSKNADAGLKTVAAAIKDAHPQWAVGEVRLKKMLSEVKTGGKNKEGPVEVQPLSLDADGRIAGIEGMDFAFRSFHDAFDFSDPEAMAKLVADCRVACRCQSFWLAAGAKPRFALERMARTVFDLHTAGLSSPYDAKTSGAEWWVHFRGPQVEDGEAIGFHWDRDETYADVTKQNVHPHVATVTYLSDHGAPTMILEQLPIAKGTCSIPKAYLSHPKLGKHVSFDGRMLHGVPPELMAPHVEKRKYTRITFLVNIWINHVPTETPPFPAKDVSKFSDVSIPSTLLSANQSAKALVKPSNSARVQGFVFGGRGEEHELWVPEFPQPNPFCDSVIIEYNTKSDARAFVKRVGGVPRPRPKKKR